jgi:hypothetical protein
MDCDKTNKRLFVDERVIEVLSRYYGEEWVTNFSAAVQTPPRDTTLRVNTLKYTIEEAIHLVEKHLGSVDSQLLDHFDVTKHELVPDCVVVRSKLNKPCTSTPIPSTPSK